MLALVKLELRRNRSAFLSAAAVFLLSLPAAFFYSRIGSAPLPLATALGGLLYFWAAPGALLAAMLFGIYGGVQLCAGSARSVEEALPMSMRKHAFAGMFAVLIHSVLFALLVWAAFAACGHAGDLSSEAVFIPPAVPFVAALFYVCVYALGSGGGGMVAGLVVSGLLYAMLSDVLHIQRLMGAAAVDFTAMGVLYVLTFCGIAGMLHVRGRTMALLPKNAVWRNWGAAAILIGVLAANMASSWAFRRHMDRVLFPVNNSSALSLRAAPPGEGVLLASGRGELALGKPSGGVEILFSPTASERAAFRYFVSDAGYAPDGSLWCLFRDGRESSSGRYRVWRMSAQGKREFVASFTSRREHVDSMILRDPEPLLFSWTGGRTLLAPLPKDDKIAWTEMTASLRAKMMEEVVRAGFPYDGGSLGPNVSLDTDSNLYAHHAGAKLGPIPMAIIRSYMGEHWRQKDWKNEGIQMLGMRGTVMDVVVLRRHLVGIDMASGRVVSSVKLPSTGFDCGEAPESYYARQDGFFLSCGRYLYFSDWSAKASRIAL